MENLGLKYLIEKKIVSLYNLIIEEDDDEYLMSDCFIFDLANGDLIQLLIDYNNIFIFKLNDINEAKVIGDYDLSNSSIQLIEISLVNTNKIYTIKKIINQDSGYVYCAVFLDINSKFLLGFILGFDEINLLTDELQVKKLVEGYRAYNTKEVTFDRIQPC